MERRALITEITGQDGSYLCALLLGEGLSVREVAEVAHATSTR